MSKSLGVPKVISLWLIGSRPEVLARQGTLWRPGRKPEGPARQRTCPRDQADRTGGDGQQMGRHKWEAMEGRTDRTKQKGKQDQQD